MKEETSPIPVSQPKIIELAQTRLKVAKDNAELAEFGIGTKFVSTFEGEIANAQTFKTDKQIVKETAALTEKKNSKLKECSKWMKHVKTFYDKLFKANSAEAKLFPQNLAEAKKSEALMIQIMPVVFDLIVKNKPALIDKEMPEDLDTKGQTLLKELSDLNKEQEDLKTNNPTYTAQRHIALSKLYNRINEINDAGRQKFADNPEKIHLFDSPWPSTPAAKKATVQNPAPEPAK